jgi:preprotein translocase subunit SecE
MMATQAIKAKNEESGVSSVASGIGDKVKGAFSDTSEFLHDVRVEMKQVTWPSREDVVATTGIVIATVFFFGVFLAAVDWLVQRGVTYVFKAFGV